MCNIITCCIFGKIKQIFTLKLIQGEKLDGWSDNITLLTVRGLTRGRMLISEFCIA